MPTIKDTCFPIFVSSLAFLVLQVCLLLLSRAATNDLAHSLTVLDQYHQLRNAAAYVRSGVLNISNVYNYWSEPQIVNIARSVHTAITDCELLLRDSDLQTQHLRVLLTA